MPRFFFHVHDGKNIPDEDGLDLDGLEEARNQAVIAAGEMLRDLDGEFWNSQEWTMQVTDTSGTTVCTLKVAGQG